MAIEITFLRILALAGTVCGIGLLQAAWRLKVRSWPHVASGWSLIIGSLVLWSFTSGADKGAALGIVASVIIALLFLLVTAAGSTSRPERPIRERQAMPDKIDVQIFPRRVCTGLLIGPIAGLVALALSTAIFVGLQAVKVEHTMNLTMTSFAFPFIWAGLAVMAGYQTKLWRTTITIVGVGLLSLCYLWIAV